MRDFLLRIFKKDILYFYVLFRTTKADWKNNSFVFSAFVCIALAWWFYHKNNTTLALIFFGVGISIYFFVLWQLQKKTKARQSFFTGFFKIKRKYLIIIKHRVKSPPKSRSNFNPISLGTLHFGVALSLWSGWVINQQHDFGTLLLAFFFSFITIMFFVAVYSRSLYLYINRQLSPFIISISFLALFAGFILGIFEALPQIPQNVFINRLVVQIVLYFGFAWIVTILLVSLRDIGNGLIQMLILVSLLVFAFNQVFQPDAISKISGIILLVIVGLSYSVIVGKLPVQGDAFEK
jgi:hypothetical protein